MSLVTGLLAAIYLVFTYMAHPLPAVFGIDQSALGTSGGMRMKWLPPEGADTERLRAVMRARVANEAIEMRGEAGGAYRDGDAFVIVVPGVPPEEISSAARRITESEGLAFRQVVTVPEMQAVPGAEEDMWQGDDGDRHVDYYVTAPTPQELSAKLASVKLPPELRFAFEQTDKGWRSYVVRDEVDLDGWSVANATPSFDPNTNRPIVLIDFDREGARRFGDLTSQIVGKKLAIMVRGRVISAPVIMGAIRGGRAWISLGQGDEDAILRQRDELLAVLHFGSLPAGGRVIDVSYVEAKHQTAKIWIARFVIGILGGLVVGWLVFFVLRWAKPTTRTRRAWTGPLPWHRIVVTLVAPAALVLVDKIAIYGVDEYVNGFGRLPIGSLGIAPFVTATILVEIVAVLIWNARRHAGADARMPITLTAAVATIGLICYQAWMMATYLDAAQVMNHGVIAKLLVVGSLAGGTAILLAAAAIVRWQGLGNGYGAIYVAGFVMHLHWSITSAFGMVMIALAFGMALRWRVGGRRIPSSSFAPLADAGGAIAIVALASQFSMTQVTQKAVEWSVYVQGHALPFVILIIVLTGAWSFAFARPVDGGWWRATALSALLLALIGLVTTGTLVDAVMIGITVAYAMDAYADLQARRQKLVLAWTLHDPHAVDAAEAKLVAFGIPTHMASSHLRTLFSFFGPFVPIDVLVPAEHVESARQLLNPTASPASSPLAA